MQTGLKPKKLKKSEQFDLVLRENIYYLRRCSVPKLVRTEPEPKKPKTENDELEELD